MNRNEAYTALLERHHAMLWRLCWKWTGGDRDRCCDMMQEVSIALWENYDKLRAGSTPGEERAWVRWQARSVLYQEGRRQELPTVTLEEGHAEEIADEETGRRRELLEGFLSALDPDERKMVGLYLEGYQGNEISRKLGISRDNYYQRMHRAIQKMKRVAAIVVVLLLTSTVAIALVPQWRHRFVGGKEPEKVVADTQMLEQTGRVESTSPRDTATLPQQSDEVRIVPLEPVERVAPMGIDEILNVPTEAVLPPRDEGPIMSVYGTQLTIMGADGEQVRVYDAGGKLVAAQTAGSFCVIDLFPYLRMRNSRFQVQIGNRSAIPIEL